MVDYKSRSIEVWNAQGQTTLHDTQTLTSALLPGFSAAVRFLLDGRGSLSPALPVHDLAERLASAGARRALLTLRWVAERDRDVAPVAVWDAQ